MSYKNHKNPSELPCFVSCSSCFRCADKGKYDKCNSCSGRHDPEVKRDPYHRDDRCRCTEGILQYRLQNGKTIVSKIPTNPFAGTVQEKKETQDERDWNRYLEEQRSRLDDPDWDPIQYDIE